MAMRGALPPGRTGGAPLECGTPETGALGGAGFSMAGPCIVYTDGDGAVMVGGYGDPVCGATTVGAGGTYGIESGTGAGAEPSGMDVMEAGSAGTVIGGAG